MSYAFFVSKSISIVLPATNETNSLLETVQQITKLLPAYGLEFIIVTDKKLTTTQTRDMIARISREFPRVESFDQSAPGLGYAVREAFAHAKGEFTVLMNADLETDPVYLPEMVKKIEEGYDIVATTRWRGGARFYGYDPLKLVLNFIFQQLFRILFWTHLTDLTFSYRIYRTEILKKIRWEESGFPFLFECMVKPLRLGYKVEEVNASWRVRSEGASHNSFRKAFQYAWVGLRIRFMPKRKILLESA